jgi:hypothetical protein
MRWYYYIIPSFIIYLFKNYKDLTLSLKRLFCDHSFHYWDTEILELDRNGNEIPTRFPSIAGTHRKCSKCGRKEKLDMRVGQWRFKKSNLKFPKYGYPFKGYINPFNVKKKQEIRDSKLNQLLGES